MLRISLAAGALALSFAMPAFAQNTMSGGMNSNSGMQSDSMSAMTCDQMMAKAKASTTTGSAAQMTMMHNEMAMAREAKAKNDEAGCKMHMQKAMEGMGH